MGAPVKHVRLEKKHHFCRFYVKFRGTNNTNRYPIRYPSSIEATNPQVVKSLTHSTAWQFGIFLKPFFPLFSVLKSPATLTFLNLKVTHFFQWNIIEKPTPPWLWGSSSSFCFEVFSIVSFWSLATKSRGWTPDWIKWITSNIWGSYIWETHLIYIDLPMFKQTTLNLSSSSAVLIPKISLLSSLHVRFCDSNWISITWKTSRVVSL